MKPKSLPRAALWLVRDTFRQSRASRAFWLMLGVTAACVAVCLSARVDGGRVLKPAGEVGLHGSDGKPPAGVDPNPGRLTLGFGAVRPGRFRDASAEVGFLQAALAEWVAGAAGTLLALVWTAGFLPEFLRPSAASVLLAKPVGRATLLSGKVLGVFAFVAFHAAVFVGGTWLALGLKTGVWQPGYLLAFPLLLANFASVFGASALLAVTTRSVAACAFGSLAFWLVGFGTNYARQLTAPGSGLGPLPAPARALVEAGYWVMPKPADFVAMLDRAVGAGDHSQALPGLAGGAFLPWLSVASSLACAAALVFAAGRHLELTDY